MFSKLIGVPSTAPSILHFTRDEVDLHGQGFYFKDKQFIHHSDLELHETAFHQFSVVQLLVIGTLLLSLVVASLANYHETLVIFVSFASVLYFIDILFNLMLIYRSFTQKPEVVLSKKMIQQIPDAQWPTYTILCPLYREWLVVPQFAKAIAKLDYPKSKLQVLLLLEADDQLTIKEVRKLKLPRYFKIVIVPHSMPKTKPKACNYGLKKATGDYIVIYDAEDVPDKLQLKKAVLAFEKHGSQTACIQAKLSFYNPNQNLLTRLFTSEYSFWFDLILPGLQSINAPIPLGGTSNHFRTSDLKKLKGWDSFNVTEDCDLGIRLAQKGYRTAMIHSTTLEEATSNPKNWYSQRTRWIKGYIQTYFLHTRVHKHKRSAFDLHFLFVQLIIGGKVMSMFINPFFWLLTAMYIAFHATTGDFIQSLFVTPIFYISSFSLIVGNFLYIYYYTLGSIKSGHYSLVKYTVFMPLYWLAMSLAAIKAVAEFITNPHYWSKTKHGHHLQHA